MRTKFEIGPGLLLAQEGDIVYFQTTVESFDGMVTSQVFELDTDDPEDAELLVKIMSTLKNAWVRVQGRKFRRDEIVCVKETGAVRRIVQHLDNNRVMTDFEGGTVYHQDDLESMEAIDV